MKENISIKSIKESIQTDIELPKRRKCGCMKESLENMKNELLNTKKNELSELLNEVKNSINKMEPTKYT